jgi:hypothetical protein
MSADLLFRAKVPHVPVVKVRSLLVLFPSIPNLIFLTSKESFNVLSTASVARAILGGLTREGCMLLLGCFD